MHSYGQFQLSIRHTLDCKNYTNTVVDKHGIQQHGYVVAFVVVV